MVERCSSNQVIGIRNTHSLAEPHPVRKTTGQPRREPRRVPIALAGFRP
jgi:hypothetical protein